jgi:hypothetical protein
MSFYEYLICLEMQDIVIESDTTPTYVSEPNNNSTCRRQQALNNHVRPKTGPNVSIAARGLQSRALNIVIVIFVT